MPKGRPTTVEGWVEKLRGLAQYASLPEDQLRIIAEDRVRKPGEDASSEKVVLDLDDLMTSSPRLRRKFTKLWKQIAKDIEGPATVKERLAKQAAMAFLLVERKMAEEWNKTNVGDGANAINNLSMVVDRYVSQLEQSPKTRKPGRGKDEKITDVLASADRARVLLDRSRELADHDRQFVTAGPDPKPEPEPEIAPS